MNESLDKKQLALAEALRGKQMQQIEQFGELEKADKGAALRFALSTDNPILRDIAKEELKGIKLEEGATYQRQSLSGGTTELKGNPKYHAPISIDTGNSTILLDPITKQKIAEYPKAHQPVAGQVVETANGPMLIDTRTGAAQPIMGAGGQPIAPKLSAEQSKDITAINQQYATINGALDAVKTAPNAFSFKRGLAQDLPSGETLAGRLDKPEEAAARAYVYNNVSAVIKERAGTAQSAGELQRLNSFMPGPKDNATQIENKLKGFKQYLADLEKGTRVNPNMPMQQTPQMPQAPQNAPQNVPQFDPKLLQYMTPEQRKLFGG
jgi:hypothetical protein